MRAVGPQVMPPTEDAVLVVRESDKQGFEVEGRVISVASGATVNAFRVHLVTHEKSGGASTRPSPRARTAPSSRAR